MIRQPTADEFAYGAMLLGFLLLGIIIGVWLGGYDNTREWIGAMSGWVAAIVAIPLGVLAWKGIQDQIKISRINENQAKQLLDQELSDFLNEINQAWRILEYSIDDRMDDGEKRQAFIMARDRVWVAFEDSKILENEGLSDVLPAVEKGRYKGFFQSLRQIEAQTNRQKAFAFDKAASADRLGIHLSHLAKDLEKFNRPLREIFKDRKQYAVDHSPSWHFTKQETDKQIEEWEQSLNSG
ncbi:hypothetical protein IWQ52_004154 [Labrenzia sp. EL_159]|nr:hypothetical protein [Labrenzia sp. EL_162]MBG6196618.1 hypothetical protein [Labrenzia sp. EL_159]